MSNSSERLSKALQSLPFVDVIKHDQQGSAVNIMCRVKPANMSDWAKLAFDILKASENAEAPWDAHIARAYILHDGALKYAWNFIIVGRTAEEVHDVIMEVVIPLIRRRSTIQSVPNQPEKMQMAAINKQSVRRTRPLRPPEADVRGNPIVPEEHRVETIAMAGLPDGYDRNSPETGKGAWSIEGHDNFRPPVKRGR